MEICPDLLRQYADAGLSARQVTKKIGVTEQTLRNHSRRHGIVFRDGRGPTEEQLALAKAAAHAVPVLFAPASDALRLGKAGEHLVCADLLARGYDAFLSDQGLPYDVLVDFGGRIIRVQVKTSLSPKNANAKGKAPNLVYQFNIRRRGRDGGGRPLDQSHCDIVALVGLAHKAIAYLRLDEISQTVALHPPGYSFHGRFVRKRMGSIDQFPPERILA